MKLTRPLAAVFSLLITASLHAAAPAPATQRASAFYPPQLLQRIRANADKDDWGRDIRKRAIDAAEPWRKMSDEQLWQLVFGATIPRSWHVFSNGHCPSCQKPVPMYDWKIAALKDPWKVRCPHCQELFPKNDFEKFYTSGLDEHGVFDPKKADRALLVNVDHPDAADPKRTFGVDDGEGFVEGDKRWRFIQTYLVYGQWKQRVEGGVKALATAYVLTGDKEYAHRAGVLLDRIADVYPTFDFKTQGILYENVRADGYVSVWHDATIETRELALSYDAVKDALAQDDALATFLAGKAKQYQPPLPKNSPADVIANIEQRILRDALANPQKIYSNFPQQQLTTAVIHTALGWPENRAAVLKMLEPVIEQSTAVDGTTGEKGLAGYSAYAAQRLGEFLGYYARMDDKFLAEMIQRHPRLPQMYRFFIDTWIAERYYPTSGDTHWFAGLHLDYAGLSLSKDHMIGSAGHSNALLTPSMYTFLWQLYQTTRDPAFAQVLYQQNDRKIDGLPFDLFQSDPAAMQRELKSVIDENGAELKLQSVNKQQWHLAVLRSGKGDDRRAVWLDYDSGGQHGHMDGMNLGLVARGLDLMPDFGYPPVQFGGWDSPRANWYKSAWSHNTVVVDGAEQAGGAGTTTMWAAGGASGANGVQAITASAPALNVGRKFERTVALIDVSEKDAYVLDIFRVAGGKNHRKFFLSHFGSATPDEKLAAALQPATDFVHPQMRNFRKAPGATPGWSVEWKIDDRYKLLKPDQAGVRLRYTDFTSGADAYLGEAWIVAGTYNDAGPDTWVPRVMTQRQNASGAADFSSTFVSLIEPFGPGESAIRTSRRLALEPASDANVALAVELRDGRSDLLISTDAAGTVTQPEQKLTTDARFAVLRRDANGKPLAITLCQGKTFTADGISLELTQPADFFHLRLDAAGSATVVAGDAKLIRTLTVNGQAAKLQTP